MDAPHLKTALPGPKAKAHHRARRPGGVAVLHARLSVRDRPRRGRHRRGRRRQRVPRLRRRHRRQLDRPLRIRRWSRRSSTRRRSSCTCRAPTSTTSRRSRLGEELAAMAPFAGPERTFFANSGTEANEAAIKLARYHTRRHGIIGFLGSFHGRTLGSLSLTSSRAIQRRGFGPLVPGTYPRALRQLLPLPGAAPRPDTCAGECLSFLEDQVLMHLVSPDDVAAVLVEPIQGEGGYVVPPAAFHQRLRELTQQARHAADGRRGAVGHGPHRQDVGDRALRRRARHGDGGQGHRLGPAARRDHRARRGDELAARRARQHVRRQPGVVRGGASRRSRCCATRW